MGLWGISVRILWASQLHLVTAGPWLLLVARRGDSWQLNMIRDRVDVTRTGQKYHVPLWLDTSVEDFI